MDLISLAQNTENQRRYTADETIFKTGELGDYMYIVIDGEVTIELEGVLVRIIGPGSIFGEMSLIDDSPRSADASAKTDCLLALVDERQFLYLVHETPMFALHMMSIMAERLRKHLPC